MRQRSLAAALPWSWLVLALAGGAAAPAAAQTGLTGTLNPLRSDSNGFQLYSLSLYSGYYSSPTAYTGFASAGGLRADMGYGVGASLGWNYRRSGSGVSLRYAPSYNGFQRYSNLSAFNHAFSLDIHNRRDPGRKWHTDVAADVNVTTVTQFLLAPGALGLMADSSASAGQLAQGGVGGQMLGGQVASGLTGASLAQSGSEVMLFGDYFLSAALQGRASYARSTRFSVSMAVAARRFEALPWKGAKGVYVLPSSTSGTATVQLAYSLTPRTQIQFDVASTRTFSRLQDSYTNTGTVSVNWLMTRRWFVEGRIGLSNLVPLREDNSFDRKPHLIGGGGIGFKTDSHTWMLQSMWTRSDPYGLGAYSTASATAAWSWRPRRRAWSALATAGAQQMSGSAATLSTAWDGRISVTRSLTRETGVTFAFGVLSLRAQFADHLPNRSLRSAVLSFYWVPGGEKRRARGQTGSSQ